MTMQSGYDFTLESLDGTDVVPGRLSPDRDNFRVKFLDITPPQISDGTAVGYASVDPRNEVVYEQSSWHQGAGLDLIREDDESKNRYAVGNGVVSLERGQISLGYDTREYVPPLPQTYTYSRPTAEWAAKPVIFDNWLYAAYDRYLFAWRVDLKQFQLIHTFSKAVRSIAVFKSRMFVTFKGSGDAYEWSLNTTTWTAKTTAISDNLQCITAKNANGDDALIIANNDQITISVDPEADSPTWSDPVDVGRAGETLINLHVHRDTLLVGKTSGLWQYDTSGDGEFVNVEPSVGILGDEFKYRNMASLGDSVYTTFGQNGMWEVLRPTSQGTEYVDRTNAVNLYHHPGRSGIVNAMNSVNAVMFVVGQGLLQTQQPSFPITFPYTFPEGERELVTRLMQYDVATGATHEFAEIQAITIDEIAPLGVETDGGIPLFVFGTVSNVVNNVSQRAPHVWVFDLPKYEISPSRSVFVDTGAKGWFTTAWHDHYFPDIDKMFSKLTMYCRGLRPADSEGDDFTTGSKIKVEYRKDGDLATDDADDRWRFMGYIEGNGFFNLPRDEERELHLTTPVIFKRIRFRFTMLSPQKTPVVIEQIVLHSVMSHSERREYVLDLEFQDQFQGQRPRIDLAGLYRLDANNRVLRFRPIGDRIGWIGEQLVRIQDIDAGTDNASDVGAVGDRGQRRVRVLISMTDA